MAKSITAYYSWGGKTTEMAKIIAEHTGSPLVEIIPDPPYSEDYETCVKESMNQVENGNCPNITTPPVNLDEADTIYLGTPVWFGTIAGPVLTFINKNNKLAGKKVCVFCTHGGGGKGKIDEDMKKFCPDAEIGETLCVKEGGTKEEIISWCNK